jgi:hypothetical protein
VGRVEGPLAFLLILQPAVATILAIRAGLKDAKEGRPAHGWAILTAAVHRRELLRDTWKDVAKVFVAAILALLPYLLIRGAFTGIVGL